MPDEVSFHFPHEVAEQLRDNIVPALFEALEAPNDAAKNGETVDNVAYLLDMALALCNRAHSLLRAEADVEGRAEIVAGIDPAWKGVYGWSLDSHWKRRLIQSVDFVARVVMVHVPSGERAQPKADFAGKLVQQVLFPAMDEAFAPLTDALGSLVEAWRIQKSAPAGQRGKYVQLADVYEAATGERVTDASLEQLFRRMKAEKGFWEPHERMLHARAAASNIHPDIRLEVLEPGKTFDPGDT